MNNVHAMSAAGASDGRLVMPWDDPRVPLPRHLYVHVPLCRSKCAYCDFYSVVDDGAVVHPEFAKTTLDLLRGWLADSVRAVPLDTAYFGGGTPTVLGNTLPVLIRAIQDVVPFAEGAEVTVEANPESLTEELLGHLVEAGVTRVSVGVQSLDDEALAWLGRPHNARAASEALGMVAAAGLDPSADLICGVPGISTVAWEASLHGVLDAGATHVSVYPLTVEEGTPLAAEIAAGRSPALDDDALADDMDAAARVLDSRGLVRYEVANYAVPGHESRHNSAYWTGKPYLGIGGGAHGMLNGRQARALGLVPDGHNDAARVRYSYAAAVYPSREESLLASLEALTEAEAAREDAMLGMRMTEGISEDLAERAGVVAVLESLVRDGLVVRRDARWRPTERGWLFGNVVFGRIWGAIE